MKYMMAMTMLLASVVWGGDEEDEQFKAIESLRKSNSYFRDNLVPVRGLDRSSPFTYEGTNNFLKELEQCEWGIHSGGESVHSRLCNEAFLSFDARYEPITGELPDRLSGPPSTESNSYVPFYSLAQVPELLWRFYSRIKDIAYKNGELLQKALFNFKGGQFKAPSLNDIQEIDWLVTPECRKCFSSLFPLRLASGWSALVRPRSQMSPIQEEDDEYSLSTGSLNLRRDTLLPFDSVGSNRGQSEYIMFLRWKQFMCLISDQVSRKEDYQSFQARRASVNAIISMMVYFIERRILKMKK